MSCAAITYILITFFVAVCLPAITYMAMMLTKYEKSLKNCGIEHKNSKNISDLPEDVQRELAKFRRWAYISVFLVLFWFLAMFFSEKICGS